MIAIANIGKEKTAKSWRDLMANIVEAYHNSLRAALPRLEGLADQVARERRVPIRVLDGLLREFSALGNSLRTHLLQQEGHLFPMIRHVCESVEQAGWACHLDETLEELMAEATRADQEALASVKRAASCLSGMDQMESEPLVGKLAKGLRELREAPADNPVTRLQQRIDAGEVRLSFEDRLGYLPAVLHALGVPHSSQMLVFSKTSLQRDRIGPKTPRALYFNDEAYIGFCQHGAVMEITAVDSKLGAVFYSLDQKPTDKPRFVRQNDACLICHGSSQNQGFPGHLLRSVYADARGYPILSLGTRRIDQCSPLRERWGGWYVTGTSGQQGHLGNLIAKDGQQPEQIENTAGRNVTDVGNRFLTASYLTPHSDIVALMVLEHQAEMHNRITRANFLTQMALHEEADLNKVLGRPADFHSDSTLNRIRSAGEPVVQYMLFSGETKLTEPVQGTSGFAREFAQRGPRDGKGRSLRDLDLQRRLFVYPCSYLIYSAAFDGLPGPVKDYVLRRLWEVLTDKDTSQAFAHLSSADRQTIREILLATKPDLPEYWRSGRDR